VRSNPSKLCTFIGEGRDAQYTLRRLREQGLLREDADEKDVFSVIVDAFIEEKSRHLEWLEMEKERGPEPADMSNLSNHEHCMWRFPWPPGENRAHMWLDCRLESFLSPKGLELRHTSERE
jgi:hypothetical protein